MSEAFTILVVDDDPDQRLIQARILASAGYQVIQATTGEECLRLVKQVPPDLVLLDVALPDMDGVKVCRAIKHDPDLAGTFVIFLAGKQVDQESQIGGLESGADGYMIKPLNERALVAKVKAASRTKAAEKAARTAQRETNQIIASIQSSLIVLNDKNVVTRWNWVAAKLLNLSSDEVNGKKFDVLPIAWEWERVLQGIRSCRERFISVRIDDVWFERPDGSDGFLKLTIDPMLDIQGGGYLGVLLLGEDITDYLLMENQLLQAQKLEGIGQLAAGIAHEINTPIQFVSDNMRFLKDAFQDMLFLVQACRELVQGNEQGNEAGNRSKDLFERIDLPFLERELPQAISQSLDGLERVAHIVRSMKSFAHPGGESMVLADVNKALENTVTVSRNEWKYVAEMDMRLDSDLPLILCHASDLHQAFLNIITNAAQAIAAAHGETARDKGRIAISTRLDGDFVEIRITDNGSGIPSTIQNRIFDPFFTTKEVGRGTGQGLVIARNAIVKRHGGAISFESEPDRGTTFIIRLPVVQDANGRAWSESDHSPEGREQTREWRA